MKDTGKYDLKRNDYGSQGSSDDASEWIWLAGITVFIFVLVPLTLFFSRARHSSSGPFYKYAVLDVIDGRTLKVHLLDIEKGVNEKGNEMQLMGIWSDKDQEPDTAYQSRLEFLRQQVAGKTVQGEAEIQVVDPNPPEPSYNSNSPISSQPYRQKLPLIFFRKPQRPAEVRLPDNTSVNELLLINGYAAFDFSDRWLAQEDRARYETAETQARSAMRGIWSTPESVQKYITIREVFERKERLKRAGLGFYLLTQLVLVSVIGILMLATKRACDKKSFLAVSKLLVIPGALLLVIFLRLVLTEVLQYEDAEAGWLLYASYLVVLFAACIWAAIQFIALVAHGPLREWQSLWKSSQAVKAIHIFLIGLGVSILLFSPIYHLAGGINSLLESLRISFSQTLSLGYPLPKTATVQKVAWAQSYCLLAWGLLCGAFVPNLRSENSPSTSLKHTIFTSLSSLAVLVLLVASVFANIFYYNIHFNGFNRLLDLGECFLLAMLPFIRKTYGDVYPTSAWMAVIESLEVCLVLVLQLVALKFIFSSVRTAFEAKY